MKSLRIRASIEDIEPEIWREFGVPADLALPDLHLALQDLFDWLDKHLHHFYLGEPFGEDSRHFFLPDSLDEGLEGEDETQFTVGDVLDAPGDVLGYEYDFGDTWLHRLELIEVVDRDADAQRVTCEGGERRGPVEDSGGTAGYERLCSVLANPNDPEFDAAREWAQFASNSDEPVDPAAFDRDAVNRRLLETFGDGRTPGSNTPLPAGALEDFAVRMPQRYAQSFRALIRRSGVVKESSPADPATPVSAGDAAGAIDAELAALDDAGINQLAYRYHWILARVGSEGVKLTSAGYLPPAVVGDAMKEFGWNRSWMGSSNREVDCVPVLFLRESMQHYRLLRKYKGVLLPAPAGRRALADSRALARDLAGAFPIRQADSAEQDAVVLLLALIAGDDSSESVDDVLAAYLDVLGWKLGGVDDITAHDAWMLVRDLRRDLTNFGVFEEGSTPGFPNGTITAPGRVFARAALAGLDRRAASDW